MSSTIMGIGVVFICVAVCLFGLYKFGYLDGLLQPKQPLPVETPRLETASAETPRAEPQTHQHPPLVPPAESPSQVTHAQERQSPLQIPTVAIDQIELLDPSSTPGEGGIIPFNPQGEMEDTGSAPPWYRRIFCCANEAGTTGGEPVALPSP